MFITLDITRSPQETDMEEGRKKCLEKKLFYILQLFANLGNDDGFRTSLTSLREGCRRLKTVGKDGMF